MMSANVTALLHIFLWTMNTRPLRKVQLLFYNEFAQQYRYERMVEWTNKSVRQLEMYLPLSFDTMSV